VQRCLISARDPAWDFDFDDEAEMRRLPHLTDLYYQPATS
jgi:hypothetical protein